MGVGIKGGGGVCYRRSSRRGRRRIFREKEKWKDEDVMEI